MSQGFGAVDFYSWLPGPKPCLGLVKLSFEEKSKHKRETLLIHNVSIYYKYFLSQLEIEKDITKEILCRNLIETR